MSRLGAIKAGRRAALAGMTDTWRVYRKTLEWSDAQGKDVLTETTIYTGPGKLQTFESYEQKPSAGAHEFTVMRPHLHLPVVDSAANIRVDDIAVCTASPVDPLIVGTEVKIAGVQSKTYATARRFPVTEEID